MIAIFRPLATLAFTLLAVAVQGQSTSQKKHAPDLHDTTYYVSYENQITGRFYFSKKYTLLRFRNFAEGYSFSYRPNTTLNMGVGATYRWATLNLAYGFGFLNPERGQGKTRYLDLQFHTYGRKIILDAFGQFYRGFYLAGTDITTDNSYYLRPDLKVNLVGVYTQYIFNHDRFSYRAAFHQNEWQKKSAGTFIAGLEAFYGTVLADSTIVPTAVDKPVATGNADRLKFFEFGPNVGYAYSLVIRKHFYITASAAVSLDYSGTQIVQNSQDYWVYGFSPNTFFRVFCGYNTRVWAISAIYLNNAVHLHAKGEGQVTLNTGNARLNFVYRFKPSRKAKRVLKYIDKVG
jgi:hypothetical protein